jgi:cytochrome c-type biogenesis protein CcmH/NrfG
LKVLEYGEEALARNPWDAGIHQELAEAAQSLGLTNLGIWCLKQALSRDPENVAANRGIARLYELAGRFADAIAHWEVVRRTDPTDLEASRKTRDLAVKETMVRAQFTASDVKSR